MRSTVWFTKENLEGKKFCNLVDIDNVGQCESYFQEFLWIYER
jgi:hypothetical protein